MLLNLTKKTKYTYTLEGEGRPILLLHGLMGGLSNFQALSSFLSKNGYSVYSLQLPLYTLPLLKTNVSGLTNYVIKFIKDEIQQPVILMGNSLGGHLALTTTLKEPTLVTKLALTGSSGLYEKSFGESYPKRGNYEYIKQKTEEVFYDPKIATKELVDEVFETTSDKTKIIKTIYIARSAIKHNVGPQLSNIKIPTCIIWGKQDNVTPPEVAEEFKARISDSQLFWIDKCGHSAMMEHPEEFNTIFFNWLKNTK